MKSQERKRMEALARQEQYDNLSQLDKLKLIESRPGSSGRERERIQKEMECERARAKAK